MLASTGLPRTTIGATRGPGTSAVAAQWPKFCLSGLFSTASFHLFIFLLYGFLCFGGACGFSAHLFSCFISRNVTARPGGSGPQFFPLILCSMSTPGIYAQYVWRGINPQADRCPRQCSRARRARYSLRIVFAHAVCVLAAFARYVTVTFVPSLMVS